MDGSELLIIDLCALGHHIVSAIVQIQDGVLQHAGDKEILLTLTDIPTMLAATMTTQIVGTKAEVGYFFLSLVVEGSLRAVECVLVGAEILLLLTLHLTEYVLMRLPMLILINHLNQVLAIIHCLIIEDVIG